MEKWLDSTVETQYKEALNYKKQMGFPNKFSEHERFYAGNQWPAATERTKNLPRPVFNLIQRIVDHKVSSVLSENIKMLFSADDVQEGPENEGADLFTKYSDTTWEELKQSQLNEEALETGAITGTGILHYYFDTNKSGGNVKKYLGKICGEVIDAMNYFPGNPQQPDVQKQPYNIITYRDQLSNVKKEAEVNGLPIEAINLISSDNDTQDQGYEMAKHELTGSEKVTVIVKYWKENGKVLFKKVASGVVIKPDTKTNLSLYPIAVMSWRRRKKSIFGTSEVEGLIPNQKGINLLMAMQLLSVQNVGWPKMIINPEYIKRRPTNEPGEVIIDTSPPGTPTISYLSPPTMNSAASGLVEAFMQYTKETTGANESAMGEQVGSQMNATAIMMLQKASGIPIESIKRRFYQLMEDVGRIWEDMWKVYYNMDRLVNVKNDDNEEEIAVFNGSNHQGTDFNLKIDIGPSSSYSETLMMTSLDKFLEMQLISFEDYLQFVPKNVVPFKDRLLKKVQEQVEMQQQQQMMMQQQQAQAQEQQMIDQQAQMEEQQQIAEQQKLENQPHPFDQELSKLPKHQQEQFRKLPPEEQQTIMDQMLPSEAMQPQQPNVEPPLSFEQMYDQVPMEVQQLMEKWFEEGIGKEEIVMRVMEMLNQV